MNINFGRIVVGISLLSITGVFAIAQEAKKLQTNDDSGEEMAHRLFQDLTAAAKFFEAGATAEGTNALGTIITEFKTGFQHDKTDQKKQIWAGLFLGAALTRDLSLERQEAPLLFLRSQFPEDDLAAINQGCVVLLLQNYYKRGAWDEGLNLIGSLSDQPIRHANLIDEVNGFCSGAIRAGHSKAACDSYQLFSTNISRIADGKHEPEDVLVMLANFKSLSSDHASQLTILKHIQEEYPRYFNTHESEIAFFKTIASEDLGDSVGAAGSLAQAAKALDKNRLQKTDSAVVEAINMRVKKYQAAGWIDRGLNIGIEYIPQDGKQKLVAKDKRIPMSTRVCFVVAFLLITSFGLFLVRFYHKKNPGHP